MTTIERRKNRSNVPHVALGLYLESVAQKGSLKALALANEDGLLVAGAGGGFDLDWLAALGPVCAGGRKLNGSVETIIEDVTGGEDLFSSAVQIGGETLYLTSVGARLGRQKETVETLGRILAN